MPKYVIKKTKTKNDIGYVPTAFLVHFHFPDGRKLPTTENTYNVYGIKTIYNEITNTNEEFLYKIGECKGKKDYTFWILERTNYLYYKNNYENQRNLAEYKISGVSHQNFPIIESEKNLTAYYSNLEKAASGDLSITIDGRINKNISGNDIPILLYDGGPILIDFPYSEINCPNGDDGFHPDVYITYTEIFETIVRNIGETNTPIRIFYPANISYKYAALNVRSNINTSKLFIKPASFGRSPYTNQPYPFEQWLDWTGYNPSQWAWSAGNGYGYGAPLKQFEYSYYEYTFEIPDYYQKYGTPENYICGKEENDEIPIIISPPIIIPEPIDNSYIKIKDFIPATYFKYTSGDSFLIDDTSYSGFFNIDHYGNITTGKYPSTNSLKLIPKNTFFSELHQNQIHLNVAYNNIPTLTEYESNVYDMLVKNELINLTKIINYNNLLIFKQLILDNQYVYNTDFQKNHYYGFTQDEIQSNPSVLTPKNDYHITSTFNKSDNWKFLDNITTGTFIVDSNEVFKYACSDGYNNYLLMGSFTENTPLTILKKTPLITDDSVDYTYNIYYDKLNDKLTYVNSEYINIYEASNYFNCEEFVISDRIKLLDETIEKFIWNTIPKKFNSRYKWNTRIVKSNNNAEFIKFGKELRTSLSNDNFSTINKYSSDIINSISLSGNNIGEVIDIAIREVDDHILILHRKQKNSLYVCYMDNNMNVIYNAKLNSIFITRPWYKIKFSEIDSDIFHIYNDYEYQTRHITFPHYPTGRMERNNLLYIDRYKWNTTFEKYSNMNITWNYAKEKSNIYNNIITLEQENNGKGYVLLHNVGRLYTLSQPLEERYMSNLDNFSLSKNFNVIECSESSIGLFFNNIITNIVRDSLELFNSSKGKYMISEYDIRNIPIDDISLSKNDFYLNGNETFNVMTIRRILLSLKEVQEKILSQTIEK